MAAPFPDLNLYNVVNAASGTEIVDNTAVPAGYHVRVLSMHAYRETGVSTFQIETDNSVVKLSPLFDTDEPITLDFNPAGWFQSESGKGMKTVITGVDWSVNIRWGIFADA